MKRFFPFALLLLVLTAGRAGAQQSYEERVRDYITSYREMAMAEQRRTGIPAAVKLGQGVLETQAGGSRLCLGANNHFGIKCKKGWTGETFAHTDDAPDECFRKYACAGDSYTDHSDFLRQSQRYAPLFRLQPTDYKGWAYGLKRCGYATNPRYAQQLIKIIEDFQLQEYTKLAMRAPSAGQAYASLEVVPEYDRSPGGMAADTPEYDMPAAAGGELKAAGSDGVQLINGLRAFYAHKGDVLLEQAIKYNVRYARLLEYNDLPDAPLEADMFVYLEKKHTKGKHQRYILQQGQSLLQVAQSEGIQLKQLYAYNLLQPGERPAPGTVLYLQQAAPVKPQLATNDAKEPAQRQQAKKAPAVEYIVRKDLPAEKMAPAAPPETTPAPPVTASFEAVPEPVAQPEEIAGAAPEAPQAAAPAAAEIKEAAPEAVTAEVPETETAPAQHPFNIADEPAVEEMPAAPEPKDEFERLKAKLDKVVYNKSSAAPATPVASAAGTMQPAAAATAQPPATAAQANPTPADDRDKFHTVKKGETAFGIAKQYGITMLQLRDWNKLEFQDIKVGQKLRVKP